MKYIELIVDWVLKSSADPAKASLTIRGAAVVAFGFIMKAAVTSCALGFFCASIDAGTVGQIEDLITNIVFWACSIIGSLGVLFGLVRKVWLTVTGKLA